MTATGVQNKRSRSDVLLRRLAAKKTVKRTMAKIVDSGEKTLNTANPVVLEGCCRETNNGGPRMARSDAATALRNTLRYAVPPQHSLSPFTEAAVIVIATSLWHSITSYQRV
jgi:hypothetical protein